ncbi:hypothetical protein DUZ99_11630 [Xylanibacillus composti]|nr:hypothetical protein [Xylanibacillus composti]
MFVAISVSHMAFYAISLNTEWLVFRETHPIQWFGKLFVIVIVPAAIIALFYIWNINRRLWMQTAAGLLWISLFSQLFEWFHNWNIVEFRSWSRDASYSYWLVVLLLAYACTQLIDRFLMEGHERL